MSEEGKWERPSSVRVPTVWGRYRSGKAMANGVAPVFRIQDYTEEWREEVVQNMRNFFLRDEPLCRSLNIAGDPVAVEEFKKIFVDFLGRKMAIIAVVDNLRELGDDSLPALAGYNLTAVVTPHEKSLTSQSAAIGKILEAIHVLEERKNCFEHYRVSEFLYALGLSVHSAFRGHGLGYEMLRARFPLCRAVGVKATVTVFTAAAAQRSAAKAGFETLVEVAYEEYKDDRGEVVFRVEEPKSMKLMGARVA